MDELRYESINGLRNFIECEEKCELIRVFTTFV